MTQRIWKSTQVMKMHRYDYLSRFKDLTEVNRVMSVNAFILKQIPGFFAILCQHFINSELPLHDSVCNIISVLGYTLNNMIQVRLTANCCGVSISGYTNELPRDQELALVVTPDPKGREPFRSRGGSGICPRKGFQGVW